MKKRLVITGLPCPPEKWERWLGPHPDQRVVTLREAFEQSQSADPRELSRYLTRLLEDQRPESILCHGLGVPLTLQALLRLKRRGIHWDTRLTLFNGPFRSISLSKAPHPWIIQWVRFQKMARDVESKGGSIDPALLPHTRRVRALFRYLILQRLADKVVSAAGLESFGRFPGLRCPVQVIASRNDPYLPFEVMERLREELQPRIFAELDYGHFPHTLPVETVRPLLTSFEQMD